MGAAGRMAVSGLVWPLRIAARIALWLLGVAFALATVGALVAFVLALAAVAAGYALSRRFVRERLRFVDAAQRGTAPWIAAAGALLVGAVAALILPFVGAGTAISFAIAVGLGVGASMMLMGALMGLVFMSNGTGHDDSVVDPLEGERRN